MRRDVHGVMQRLLLVGSLLVACLAIGLSLGGGYSTRPELSDCTIRSNDGEITASWQLGTQSSTEFVRMEVLAGDEVIHRQVTEAQARSASYADGDHGKLYRVRLVPLDDAGTEGEVFEKEVLFLEYGQLPDLPLLTIETASGKDPTFDIRDKPDEEVWGDTITNNESVSGDLKLENASLKDFTSELELRVRGNTSNLASGTGKYGYHLELESPYALPGYEGEASKDWALLNTGEALNTYVGDWVGDQCGMEWQPHMMFVNLMINGDWKGTYCLTPTICIQNSFGLVGRTGYVFEADAYWWAADGIYFRTKGQIPQMAFTFKYPTMHDANDAHITRLKNYMQDFEDCLSAGDTTYSDYIDEDSFARWMLARDILGNIDAAGTNVYYYKYDFDFAQPTSSKVKMGPLWDYDASFASWDRWSDSRDPSATYFSQLFERGSFNATYQEIWTEIGPHITSSLNAMLDQLDQDQGDALDESWRLESARWGTTIHSFAEQSSRIELWFEARVPWIYNALGMTQPESTALDISSFTQVTGAINAQDNSSAIEVVSTATETVRGWAYFLDMTQATRYTIPGVLVGNRAYLANSESREDVQATYGLSSDDVGYYAALDIDIDEQSCIVDIQNRILYL